MLSIMTFRLANYVLILILIFIINIRCSNGTGVPVLIWGTGGQTSKPIDSNHKSLIARIDSKVLSDDYLKKSQTIIAFIQNDLSIEQFSTEDTNRFETLNHIMTDQTLDPIFLTDVLSPNKALKDFSIQDINNLNINNGKKIVINLPKDSLVENDELIGEMLQKISQNVSKNTLFLITGRQNSEANEEVEDKDQIKVNQRYSRHILAENLGKKGKNLAKSDENLERLVNIEKCLYFYVDSIAVKLPNLTFLFDSLKNKPIVAESHCWKENGKVPALLDLTYAYANGLTKLQIILEIGTNKSDFWRTVSGSAILTNSDKTFKYQLKVDALRAEKQFSYSCSKLTILGKLEDKSSESGSAQIELVLNRLQLQPFGMSGKRVFGDSSDCTVFLTIPIWMGFLTLMLLTIILLIGVYMLSQVNTSDRFENPKGKPLIITNADE